MRSIAIVSGKGGVGKTTTAINLGIALNSLGKSTLIIDANVSTPDIALSLGAPIVPTSLQQALSKKIKPENAIYRHHSGTKIMPSSISFSDKVDLSELKEIVEDMKKKNDVVLIDCAAGINPEAISVVSAADECLIVTNPEMLALTSALKTIKVAKELGKKITGIIVTKTKGKNEIDIENIKKLLENEILGKIPDDKNIKKALEKRDAVFITHPRSKASKGYKEIAKIISGTYESTKLDKFLDIFEDLKKFISK